MQIKRRSLVYSVIILIMVCVIPFQLFAIDVIIDGNRLTLTAPAEIIEGRTVVPMRGIFEALGAQVTWDEMSRSVIANRGSTAVVFTIGQNLAQVNGAAVTMDVPSVIIDDTVRVPLRFVSEALGERVSWDPNTQIITITQTSVIKSAQDYLELWGITKQMQDFDKVKRLYDGLIANVAYGVNSRVPSESNTAYGALISRRALSLGYARAFSVLAREAGLESRIIEGEVLGLANPGQWSPHAWNLVKIGVNWYHLDSAMQDAVNKPEEMKYSWLNLTDAAISIDHRWTRSDGDPVCSSTAGNYYYNFFNDNDEFLRIRNEEELIMALREAYYREEKAISVNLTQLGLPIIGGGDDTTETHFIIRNLVKWALDPVIHANYLVQLTDARDLYESGFATGSFIIQWQY